MLFTRNIKICQKDQRCCWQKRGKNVTCKQGLTSPVSIEDVITARKQSLRRLCFYTCLSVHRGEGEYLGRYTPRQVHPPDQVHPLDQVHPPWDQVHPLGPGTPPWTRYTPQTRYTPLDQLYPPGTRYIPPGPGTPPWTRYTPLGPGTPHETRYTPRPGTPGPGTPPNPPSSACWEIRATSRWYAPTGMHSCLVLQSIMDTQLMTSFPQKAMLSRFFFTIRNEVAKVIFLQVCVCPQWGWYPSMPCRWYPSMPCSRSPGGCAIPACIAGGIPACLATGLQGGCAWSGGVAWSRGCLVQGVSALGGVCSQGGVCSGGSGLGGLLWRGHWGRPPRRDSYCCRRYASHWNAFLFAFKFVP